MPVRLLEAAATELDAYARGGAGELGKALAVAVPAGWPEFPEALTLTRRVLEEHPEQAGWWMYFFIDPAVQALVGSGGFKGPPKRGVVELGYEVAPGYRGRGYATDAARQLVHLAFSRSGVTAVDAHTLASGNASAGVLRRTGFVNLGAVFDPEAGEVWHWRRKPDRRDDGPHL